MFLNSHPLTYENLRWGVGKNVSQTLWVAMGTSSGGEHLPNNTLSYPEDLNLHLQS